LCKDDINIKIIIIESMSQKEIIDYQFLSLLTSQLLDRLYLLLLSSLFPFVVAHDFDVYDSSVLTPTLHIPWVISTAGMVVLLLL
jgi:cytochrome bd-type quinol oxidase subunit 2